MLNFDVAIIGGGIGGLMAAYRLKEKDSNISIVITERGNTLEKGTAPQEKTVLVCIAKPVV